jgi:hypothetical protein
MIAPASYSYGRGTGRYALSPECISLEDLVVEYVMRDRSSVVWTTLFYGSETWFNRRLGSGSIQKIQKALNAAA